MTDNDVRSLSESIQQEIRLLVSMSLAGDMSKEEFSRDWNTLQERLFVLARAIHEQDSLLA